MRSGCGVRFGRIGGGAAAVALALTLASTLSACASAGSGVADTKSTSAPSTPADPMAAVRVFCADLQTEGSYGAPVIGSANTAEALALFDRLAAEAPPPVKDAMQAADTAAHNQARQGSADGMKLLVAAMQPVKTWASSPANCPPPGKK